MRKSFTISLILVALLALPAARAQNPVQSPQSSAYHTNTVTYTNTAGVPTATAVVTYSGPETSTLTNTATNTGILPPPLQPKRQPANPAQPEAQPRLSPGDMNTNQPIPPVGSPTTNTNPINPTK